MIYQCPKCGAKFRADAAGLVICPACNEKVMVEVQVSAGNAWDRASKGGWVNAFIETIKRSLIEPQVFFEEVSAGTGWFSPLIFAVIVYTIVYMTAAAYQAGFQGLAMSAGIGSEIKNAFIPALALSIPVYVAIALIMIVVAMPLLTAFMLFIQSAICHLCLIIVGGASRDFHATFRTACYSSGPQIIGVVPILGQLVAPIWQIVLLIIGLKVVHKTTYAKSVLAVFLPMLLCCGVIILVAIAIAGGVTGALLKH